MEVDEESKTPEKVSPKNESSRSYMTKEEIEQQELAALRAALPSLSACVRLRRRVGAGTFSAVYEAVSRAGRRHAVKHLLPTAHPSRVAMELRCLRDIGGKNNVIGVDLCLRNLDTIVIVMPFIPHKRFSEYVRLMDAAETAAYMRALLGALRHVHAFGVIHRDVKPANFLYDRERRRYMLVDFGLAQRIVTEPRNNKRRRESLSCSEPVAKRAASGVGGGPRVPRPATRAATDLRAAAADASSMLNWLSGKEEGRDSGGVGTDTAEASGEEEEACACAGVAGVCEACSARPAPRAPRAGTQGFRPPEVLLKVPTQSCGVDVWAAGVVLGCVLAARAPLLRAAGDSHALAELCTLLGANRMRAAAASMRRRLLVSECRALCLRRALSRLRAPPARPAPPSPASCLARAAPRAACRPRPPDCVCDDGLPGTMIRAGAQWAGFPDAAYALLYSLLEPDPARRPSAAQALAHPFLTDY